MGWFGFAVPKREQLISQPIDTFDNHSIGGVSATE
jgi:hypothetical protein